MHRIPKVFAATRRALGGSSFNLLFPLRPVPASRPRVGRWGTYYLKTYNTWRREAQAFLRDAKSPPNALSGPLAIITEVIYPRPQRITRWWPRGDTDNYEKATWDSITSAKKFWADDDQIVLNLTTKRYAKRLEAPGVQVEVWELDGERP